MESVDNIKKVLSEPVNIGTSKTPTNNMVTESDVTEQSATDTAIPATQLTEATPEPEKEKSIEEQDTFNTSMQNDYKQEFDSVTSQPERREPMSFSPSPDDASNFQPRSSYTLSEAGSGYDREQNECADFCLDFCSCFGLLEACCPTDSDGCVTTFAICLGNVIFGCCRCK